MTHVLRRRLPFYWSIPLERLFRSAGLQGLIQELGHANEMKDQVRTMTPRNRSAA